VIAVLSIPDMTDYAKVDAVSRKPIRLAYTTIGNPSDPCVVMSPGGGATKAMCLFWARDLAEAGPFYIVMYDTRCSGESEGIDHDAIFSPFDTTAAKLMKKIFGGDGEDKKKKDDKEEGTGMVLLQKDRNYDAPAGIMDQLHDTDAFSHDIVHLMDSLGIEKFHLAGLSQGGLITLNTAMLYPERVLSAVAAAAPFNEATSMLGMFSPGADDFYDAAAKLQKEKDAALKEAGATLSKEQHVYFQTKSLELIVPGFPKEVYEEMSSKEFDYGIFTENQIGISALSWVNWRNQGKIEKLHERLTANTQVPIMIIQGKKDPICWYGHFQKLYAVCSHSVKEEHEYGHNFGPLEFQKGLMGRTARWMKKNAGMTKALMAEQLGIKPKDIGGDTFADGVSAELHALAEGKPPEIKVVYDAFCFAQTAADVLFAFDVLIKQIGLEQLKGQGIKQFQELSTVIKSKGLSFKQMKLIQDLEKALSKAHGVVAKERQGKSGPAIDQAAIKKAISDTISTYYPDAKNATQFNKVVICGAGPVGLRTACEMALLGFEVKVVEKRPNFSRANILTFWDPTMADMLALGAKTYFPDLQPTGVSKFLGTRQIQVCFLKTLLLLGGTVEYGREICGLIPPSEGEGGSAKWRAKFRRYVKHRRAGATDFQASKEYAISQKVAGLEECEVDENFIGTGPIANSDPAYAGDAEEPLDPLVFDAYVIAEGGWSDSTKKLGFNKNVENFKPVFGLVINMNYDPADLKEREAKSSINFCMSGEFPLRQCAIQAEFIEYLKGETHFFALVVTKKNKEKDTTERHLANMSEEERSSIPEVMLDALRFSTTQKGLLEMGVLREEKANGRECLAKENVDEDRLMEMAREIATEMGLPPSATFYPTNPVQLFDFSRRARCAVPVRVLDGGKVVDPSDYVASGDGSGVGTALVLPVGDALQEPNWTQGLGINRGFHTAMNQAYSLMVAREKSRKEGVQESIKIHQQMSKMTWGGGSTGLAGSGTGCPDLKAFKDWDADPKNRFKLK
jgi:pimeloyl-ACP methyl ester carboxylesterase